MPLEFSYNCKERTVEIRCSGELVIEEILKYFKDLKEADFVEDGSVELVDLSRVEYFNVDFKGASEMPAGYTTAHSEKQIRATILFGTNRLNEGLAELIRAHFNQNMPNHPFKIVASEADALTHARRIHAEYNQGAC